MSRAQNGSAHPWQAALAGEVDPAVAAHLEQCAACAALVDGVQRAAHDALADVPPPPAGLDERVLGAIDRARRADARVRSQRRRAVRAALGAPAARPALAGAVIAVIVVLALALRPGAFPERAEAVPVARLSDRCPRSQSGGGGERLVVAGVWSGPEAASFARVLERFERKTGIQVSYAYETRTIAAKLDARIERGCAPDVALLPQPGLMTDLAHRGEIHPIGAAARRLVHRNYTPAWQRLGTVDARLYGVWFKAADKSTLWYRADAFRAAGIDAEPRSWAQLLAAARTLARAGVTPFSIAGGDGWTLTDWFENVYLRSAGAARYDALSAHAIPWTDPSVADALRRLAAVLGDEALVGEPEASRRTTFEESVRRVFGPRPSAAMVYEGDFVRSFIPEGAAARGARFFRFPAIAPGSQSSAVVGGDVAVRFTASRRAEALLRFLATPEAAEPWAREGGLLSPNSSLDRSVYPDALARRSAIALAEADTVRFDLSDLQPPAFGASAEQGMWEIFRDFLADPRDIKATMQRLEAAASAARACERANRGAC